MTGNALLAGLTDPEEIEHRHRALGDCLEDPEVVREIYDIALERIQGEPAVTKAAVGVIRRGQWPLFDASGVRLGRVEDL